MRAQDVKAHLKNPRRRAPPWIKDDEDTSTASEDLQTVAAPVPVAAAAVVSAAAVVVTATAAAAKEAALVTMAATETEPVEAAEVVQARSLPLRSPRTNHPCSHRERDATATA